MPIYEYECKSCSLKFEVKKSFDESIEASCPSCSGESRRLFCPVPIVFKGPGFYVTDKAAEERSRSGGKGDGEKPSNGSNTSNTEKGGDKKNEVAV